MERLSNRERSTDSAKLPFHNYRDKRRSIREHNDHFCSWNTTSRLITKATIEYCNESSDLDWPIHFQWSLKFDLQSKIWNGILKQTIPFLLLWWHWCRLNVAEQVGRNDIDNFKPYVHYTHAQNTPPWTLAKSHCFHLVDQKHSIWLVQTIPKDSW